MSRLIQEIPSKAPRKGEPNSSRTLVKGDFVYVRYKDHTFFKDADPSIQIPRILQGVGRLHYQNEEFLRFIFEQYSQPVRKGVARTQAMGTVILKCCIVELRKLEDNGKVRAIFTDSFLGRVRDADPGKK